MTRLLVAIVLLVSIPVEAKLQRYEQKKVRETLLRVHEGLPLQTLKVTGAPASRKAAKFVEFYKETIFPKLQNMMRTHQRRSAINVLIDTGSYNNEEEKTRWKEEYAKITAEISGMQTDPVLNGEIALWGELAADLPGELPEYARRFAKENELEHFGDDQKETLTAVDLLHQEYKSALIASPAARGLGEFLTKSNMIPRQFKTGALTFEQARDQLTELNKRLGYRYVGFEAVQAKGESLNRMAILRTKLAQSKGFRTWAEYQLEASGQGYQPEYRGVANQRAFLHQWIDQLRPVMAQFIDRRLRDLGVDKTNFRRNHIALLTLPDLSFAQSYFPADKLTDIFERTMLQSGFRSETLNQIIVDDKERQGLKNPTMAYMAPVSMPEAEVRTLDATTLSFLPAANMRPGIMYIMQTFRNGGTGELSTEFHEGMGHALEFLLKQKEELTGEGYGYVEVPSMTAEYFVNDAQFLYDNAVEVDGQKPSLEQFQIWARNSKINEGLNLLLRASSALYDTDLWDYNYAEPGAMTYLQRAEQVSAANEKRTGLPLMAESDVPGFYGNVASTHFTSGAVRNIGYSYASLGSEMMAQFITTQLEAQTGRGSWYQQPGLAALITDKFYRVGWKTQFPKNIEDITGLKFDVQKILADMTKDLNCETSLTAPLKK